jgi:hypothetical protein
VPNCPVCGGSLHSLNARPNVYLADLIESLKVQQALKKVPPTQEGATPSSSQSGMPSVPSSGGSKLRSASPGSVPPDRPRHGNPGESDDDAFDALDFSNLLECPPKPSPFSSYRTDDLYKIQSTFSQESGLQSLIIPSRGSSTVDDGIPSDQSVESGRSDCSGFWLVGTDIR